ncbi:NAD(P)H-dependent glycerol-3-phosphate dehydrogenase [Leuconostoc gelidum]|uniref:NAD(P)H-dependent glycerol-3-phosphate dehydrogenase n=1 Tax=Leuconostoc gelidum TaxID=1244 RepID=UPI001C7DB731|nr:NAD(P)H-dependent glycerol-3-phosphate dehydrogenase [Leuconostoc gelidum]MBZ6008587.1 NAD(P)H-dependent glycerol-3-phosphate dehydrogenase [Leuconostoc gelidum subsp. aenigmaticum]MBZ6010555.1 NAD(P)H-dependent glycerol-3-phosphate dehydrogenase [Leuconostoc gelidum subsp. aenigmaticum]
MTKIAVLGAGSWGTALANTAAENGHDVRLWTHNPDQVEEINQQHTNVKYLPHATLVDTLVATSDMFLAIENVEIVLSVVPTKAVREVAKKLATALKEQSHTVILAHATKGLEQGSYKRISEMIAEEVPEAYRSALVVISGPSHAEDVIKHDLTAVSIGSSDESAAKLLQKTLSNETFRAYTNHDLLGSELFAALKNIVAIASGALIGLGYGVNAQAALLTRSLVEMRDLGAAMGAKPETLYELAGIGDLIVTGMSPNSRNYRAGLGIGKGKSLQQVTEEMGMVIEGVNTTKAVYDFSKTYHVDMPITVAVYQVLYENKPLHTAISDLMARPLKSED